MSDRPNRLAVPRKAGFYKIEAGVEGLPPWAQYFDGIAWHGAAPPPGAIIYDPLSNDYDESEDQDERDGEEIFENELEEWPVTVPNIEVEEFKCGSCNGTEIGRRISIRNGITSCEIFCASCKREKEKMLKVPLLLQYAGRMILDEEGHSIAVCDWLSKDDKTNAEIARLLVTAVNAWRDVTQLVNSSDADLSCFLCDRIAKQVRAYQASSGSPSAFGRTSALSATHT